MKPLFRRLEPERFDPLRLAAREVLSRAGVGHDSRETSFGSMHFYDTGADRPGPPLVFLHGIASDAQAQALLALALAPADPDRREPLPRRAILVDLFDFAGGSRRWTSARGHRPLDPSEHAASVIELLEALGVHEADFVAVSLGGWIALLVAATSSRARGLFLVNPAGARMDKDELRELAAIDGAPRFDALYRRIVGAGPLAAVPLLRSIASRGFRRALLTQEVRGFLRSIREEHFVDDLLPRITCPTFLLVAREDALLPPGGALAILNGIAGARGAWVEGASHNLPFDGPANVYLALRDFLGLSRAPHPPLGRLWLHARRLLPTTPMVATG